MRYLPITDKERKEMLDKIGVKSVSDLFSPLPQNVLLKKELNIPSAKSDPNLKKSWTNSARKIPARTCFPSWAAAATNTTAPLS